MMTAVQVETIPPITGPEVERLARAEYARGLEQLRSLDTGDWTRPTDCELWDVRAMAGHSVAMMGDFSSYRALVRRMRLAGRTAKAAGGPMVDGMTSTQVADSADLSTAALLARAADIGPKAARWRAGANPLFRKMPIREEVGGQPETWRMGYLLDVILTRDPWMHRVDIARATGREMELTPDHDGRIVADVVAEWARRHGHPTTLTLTGPAGGEFVAGDGGGPDDGLTMDAVEFCRTLSGRTIGSGLLAQEVPF